MKKLEKKLRILIDKVPWNFEESYYDPSEFKDELLELIQAEAARMAEEMVRERDIEIEYKMQKNADIVCNDKSFSGDEYSGYALAFRDLKLILSETPILVLNEKS